MAALALLVPALGYTLMYTLGWLAGGAPSTFTRWLAIPIEQYFTWDIFIVDFEYASPWSTLLWTVYSISFLRLIFLFARGLTVAKGLGWGWAIPLGVVTPILYQGVYLVFNR
ncbi:MAG TPA: hypothetical protein VL354_10960 [Spirochaetia bacterium]|nr:hypothetical protein [Spirochaetia bacterium]